MAFLISLSFDLFRGVVTVKSGHSRNAELSVGAMKIQNITVR